MFVGSTAYYANTRSSISMNKQLLQLKSEHSCLYAWPFAAACFLALL
jgi:hypothetical protein